KHLMTPNTPLPTSWPKEEFEKHSIAYQEIRRQMRADNVPEAEMNKLFRDNQVFVENLFDESGRKGVVGAFEGGNYQATGYYRSEQNCLMFTRTEAFCAVCAEAIEKVIDEYTLR
ncbi:MAG: M64 family metallopeptidase, partial [Gammaproteobacteria bacterium]|nr:M64 family metallopeptidase [Gammaproteobacteria bacterium]